MVVGRKNDVLLLRWERVRDGRGLSLKGQAGPGMFDRKRERTKCRSVSLWLSHGAGLRWR